MKRRVLLTGGAGFIGSHLVRAHLGAGDEVTVLDDLSSGKAENLPEGVRLVRADVRSPEARSLAATGGFTILNHHAAQMDVRRSVEDPLYDAQINVIGLLNVLEGARAGRTPRRVRLVRRHRVRRGRRDSDAGIRFQAAGLAVRDRQADLGVLSRDVRAAIPTRGCLPAL